MAQPGPGAEAYSTQNFLNSFDYNIGEGKLNNVEESFTVV